MPEIEIALWQRYIQVAEARKESFHKHRRKEITDEEWLVQLETNTTADLQDLCAKSYADSLMQFPEDDRALLYFEDIKRATKTDDLHMLHVLDFAPSQCSIAVPVEIDEFLLSYYVDFFKRTTDSYDIHMTQILFEQVLDTSESDLDIYTWVIDEIFSMNKGDEWFDEFYHGVQKLLLRAPTNDATHQAMKKGLVGTSKSIKEEIEEIIAYTYENRRRIFVLVVQEDEEDILALLQFENGIAPEIGMELKNNEVTCRIEYFQQDEMILYRCLLTVVEGELTAGATFEIKI